MLDVHPPSEKMHGVKDFLLHLFTITIGLFIALLLEGCVERYHKSELRKEAEANLRLEIEDNAKELATIEQTSAVEQKNLLSVLDFLAAKEAGKPFDIKEILLGFSLGTMSDSSWRTASATGALGLMNYDHVQAYAGAYEVQEQLMRLEEDTLNDFLRVESYVLHGFDPDKVTPAEAAAAAPDVRHALVHLVAVQQIGTGLGKKYEEALHMK